MKFVLAGYGSRGDAEHGCGLFPSAIRRIRSARYPKPWNVRPRSGPTRARYWGSTPISSPADTVGMVIAACAQLGERLLVCTGPHDMSGLGHFDHVKFVSAVNHAAVLPACSAVVHHGGAGTTAAAMRAGVSKLIMWLWLDQPVWAAAVQQLKVGSARRFSDTTEESLVADLKSILAPEYRSRARNIASQMMPPHESASLAADLVEGAAHAGSIA